MSRHRHPEGSRLPALERNILKYRAFEMMLTLFYAEELKQYLLGTMKATDHCRDDSRKWFPKGPPHYRAVVERLAKEAYITDTQRDEIIKIVDYRNDIARRPWLPPSQVGFVDLTRLPRGRSWRSGAHFTMNFARRDQVAERGGIRTPLTGCTGGGGRPDAFS